MLKKSLGALAITLLTASFAFAGPIEQARISQGSYTAVQSAQVQRPHPLQGAADWRERMQKNHSADRSIEQ